MLSVREITQADIDRIADYWLQSDPVFLQNMGVDLSKMPNREQWVQMLSEQLEQPYEHKKSYATIWEIDGVAVGHCNVNKIEFGASAHMHLHLWQPQHRMKGAGVELVKMSLPWFFNNLQLQVLFCEPYALNPAPNKTLEKLGFQFVRQYRTTPGWINFEQDVNLWQLKLADWKVIKPLQA